MAVVMVRKYGNATVTVCDDAYINCPPEEMAARKRRIDEVVSRILSKPENLARLIEAYRLRDATAGTAGREREAIV